MKCIALKILKWKLKFSWSKHTITSFMKRQAIQQGNIFAIQLSGKELLSTTYNKKTNSPLIKWAKDLKHHFIKEYVPRANKMRRCWTPLVLRKWKLKPLANHSFIPSIKVKTEKNKEKGRKKYCNTKYWEDMKKEKLSYN